MPRAEKLTTRIHRCLHGETPGEHIDADEAAVLLEEARARIEELEGALRDALHEMRHTVAPRNSFTDVVDKIDAVLTKDQGNG